MIWPKSRRSYWGMRRAHDNSADAIARRSVINVENEEELRAALDKTGFREIAVVKDITVRSQIELTSGNFKLSARGAAILGVGKKTPFVAGGSLFIVKTPTANPAVLPEVEMADCVFDGLHIGQLDGAHPVNTFENFITIDGGWLRRPVIRGCTMALSSNGSDYCRVINSLAGEEIWNARITDNYFRLTGGVAGLLRGDLGNSIVSNNYIVSGHIDITGSTGNNVITGNIQTSGGIDLNNSNDNVVIGNKCSTVSGTGSGNLHDITHDGGGKETLNT